MVIQGVSPLYSNLFSYSVLYSYLYSNSVSFWHTPYAVLVHPHSLLVHPLYRFGIPTLQLIMQKRIPYTI